MLSLKHNNMDFCPLWQWQVDSTAKVLIDVVEIMDELIKLLSGCLMPK